MIKYSYILLRLVSFVAFSQKEVPLNYRKFDKKVLNFGFMLGFNSSNFNTYQKLTAYQDYQLLSVIPSATIGGQLGIVSTLKIGTPVVRLRFLPTLSFQERVLDYTFLVDNGNGPEKELSQERVNSTNLDFPLMFQFRTLRINNFAAYVLVGGQYSYDLQSQEDASQSLTDPFVKIKRNDFSGQVGGGLEFFAPYFKFGIELKYSHSIYNSMIQDNSPVSKPIQSLYNRGWWVSFIFEG
ncbi:MAG: hypothetical protein RIT10_467 [Bacteroidota bacterium]|jgi:hypothetical protein